MSEAPEKIYLQICEANGVGEVSWCMDQINDSDPCYVLEARAEKAEAELAKAQTLIKGFRVTVEENRRELMASEAKRGAGIFKLKRVYLLFGGMSSDGSGIGEYIGRTLDSDIARKHFLETRKDPYSTGGVQIVTDAKKFTVQDEIEFN